MTAWHSQDGHVVRVEWGPSGALSLCSYAAGLGSAVTAVVVDVLSFTTSVSVAADAGMAVLPYRWSDDGAARFAQEQGATLARTRSVAVREGGISLSPGSIRAASGVERVVLPSPNGSTISTVLAEAGATVVAGSLRNRAAVGRWLVDLLTASVAPGPTRARGATGASGGVSGAALGPPVILIVPAGERWPDDSLRPAIEDLWGAGGIIGELVAVLEHRAGPLLLSPEAEVALAAWLDVHPRLAQALAACASGRELIGQGHADDVAIAGELDSSAAVPVLDPGTGAFRPSP